jgi:hypothetical protein
MESMETNLFNLQKKEVSLIGQVSFFPELDIVARLPTPIAVPIPGEITALLLTLLLVLDLPLLLPLNCSILITNIIKEYIFYHYHFSASFYLYSSVKTT